MRPDSHRPIGVFDSGVGGLTVLKALTRRLPAESTVYLGDTARVPYGTKSGAVVTRYSLKNAEFLRTEGVKLLVVACNTASAVALPALRAHLDIPVVGVIEPGAEAAVRASRGGVVGVIGTPGTIRSGAYQQALEGLRPGGRVLARACPLFVPLAEEGWLGGDVPRLVAREYLAPFRGGEVDTLVLGCTHYPLLSEVIAEEAGSGIRLVDSAEATADAVAQLLEAQGMLAPVSAELRHAFFVTDVPERFAEVGARFLGRPIERAEQIDITYV
ncbi:MAG: glutamate racemase [Myxococcaceae bacterium]|nr:glutamate racemase [Myxococcaceae bacterium]MCI0670058.1 glutamate racemase [Myxococcaceae bacterium]